MKGAIVLDSILHYNGTDNSQDVGREWTRLVPEAVEDIKAGNGKGGMGGRRRVRDRPTRGIGGASELVRWIGAGSPASPSPKR